MGPLIYLSDTKLYTVSLGLRVLSEPGSVSGWGAMFAMSTLSLLPVLAVLDLSKTSGSGDFYNWT